MGLFDRQNKKRREADLQLLEESFAKVAGVILGERQNDRMIDERIVTKGALDEILKFFHYKSVEVPESITEPGEQLDYCLRPYGIMRRSIELQPKWYKNAFGPILAFRKSDGMPVALLPRTLGGYSFSSPTGERIKVTAKNCDDFEIDALCFYRPMPMRKLGIRDLFAYMGRCMSTSDVAAALLATFIVTLINMLLPRITKALTGPIRASGNFGALGGVAIFAVCVVVSAQVFTSIQGLVINRIQGKASLGVEASMMMRVISLPATFFRNYTAGELKTRAMSVNQLCQLLLGVVTSTSLTSLSSLLFITQIFQYAPSLVIPSLVAIVATVVLSIVTTSVQADVNKRLLETRAEESGLSFSLISGIQKLKLAGAEKRAFAKWLDIHANTARLKYDPPLFLKISGVLSKGIGLVATIVLYYIAVSDNIGQSDYFAFSAAYGSVMGAFTALAGVALQVAMIEPILETARPFLEAEPETADGKEIVTEISGGIWMDHVTFRYAPDSPVILDDLSLQINPGEYVAIVGRTGCGKSTIMRLLLGFEQPEKGAIYYDSRDIDGLDLPSLRRKIGTVTQTGGLFRGSIFSNITLSAPWLSMEEAWEAAEMAGIAGDIREMPMGMHTVVASGAGGMSGGQAQRIMIARAVAPKPKLLLLDEATSALDNKTQRQVSEALDGMGCTRVVIAHRLSTIKHCDRILVLDGGHIVEDGTYEELIERGGFFAELVERQRL